MKFRLYRETHNYRVFTHKLPTFAFAVPFLVVVFFYDVLPRAFHKILFFSIQSEYRLRSFDDGKSSSSARSPCGSLLVCLLSLP